MKRTSYADMPCPLAQALEVVGEWWSLLILREAFFGVRQFGEFERRLGIAKNVLSRRLKDLVQAGVLERRPSTEDARQVEYRLTAQGKDLLPTLIALSQWGERWIYGGEAPRRFANRQSGAAIAPIEIRDMDGLRLGLRDITLSERHAGTLTESAADA